MTPRFHSCNVARLSGRLNKSQNWALHWRIDGKREIIVTMDAISTGPNTADLIEHCRVEREIGDELRLRLHCTRARLVQAMEALDQTLERTWWQSKPEAPSGL